MRSRCYRLVLTPIRMLAGSVMRGDDGVVERISVPYFFDPSLDARLRAHPDVAAAHGYVG
jgi:hypothetical protein